MPDPGAIEGLIGLKREFIHVGDDLAALSQTMPSALAVITGTATEDPADRERWNTLHTRRADLAEQIHRHPAFAGLSQTQRHELDRQASKAARDEENAHA